MEFETKLQQLESIAAKLGDKALPLEEGIALYEQGVSLTKDCLKSLSECKGRIAVIRKEMDELLETSPIGE